MENSSPLAIDISSDEETALSDTAAGDLDDSDDHDWLSELLGGNNGADDDADSDEVVFVSELFPKTLDKSLLQQPLNSTAKAKLAVDDEDECVILECDPEKPVLEGNAKDGGDVSDDDSDDLQIVGEKGEVACRDFPHSRHLCGMHLFASTPHEVHCSQCHCYVCDSIAPCDNWGNGTSSIDHCHATDKEEFWRAQRKSKREGDNPLLIPSITNPFVTTEVPAHSQPHPNSLLPNHTWRPIVLRPCSAPSNNRMANVVNPGRCYPVGRSIPNPRYKPQKQLYSPELPAYNNHGPSSYGETNRSLRFYPSRVQFKRTEFRGVSHSNRARYFRSSIRSQSPGYSSHRRSPAFSASRLNECHFLNEQGIGNWMGNSMPAQLESSIPPNVDVRYANFVSSLPQIHSPSVPSFQLPSQPDLSSNNFVDVLPFESHIPPPVLTNQSDAGSAFQYQLNAASMVSSHPNMSKTFENQSYQPHTYDNINPSPTNGRSDFQLGNQTQSGLDMSTMCFGSDWHVSHSLITQASAEEPHSQSAVPADSSHNQSTLELEDDHNEDIAPVENYHMHHVAAAAPNFSVDASNSHFSGIIDSDQLDAQFQNWMFQNPSSPVASEGPLLPYWHSPSPETDSIASGTLFDI